MQEVFHDRDGNIHNVDLETGDVETISREEIEWAFDMTTQWAGIFKTLQSRPDLLGEVLRHMFFEQDKHQTLRPNVQLTSKEKTKISAILKLEGLGEVLLICHYTDKCVITFSFEDKSALINMDSETTDWFWTTEDYLSLKGK
jgi:hypothetical protein